MLTNEECVWGLIGVQQGHGLGVEAQPQSYRQDKGAHQLQEGRENLNVLGENTVTYFRRDKVVEPQRN